MRHALRHGKPLVPDGCLEILTTEELLVSVVSVSRQFAKWAAEEPRAELSGYKETLKSGASLDQAASS